MTELKHILVEELLNALDDIQRDVPFILDYYMDTNFSNDDNIHMNVDLLTMNIMSLRDSAKLIRDTISINCELPSCLNYYYTLNGCRIMDKRVTGECKSILDSTVQSYPASISTQVKQLAFAMFLHTHMLTDPESIYNSGIIGNKDLFTVES
jgi:hypothetical protein